MILSRPQMVKGRDSCARGPGRSVGITTALTQENEVGTSIWESARAYQHPRKR